MELNLFDGINDGDTDGVVVDVKEEAEVPVKVDIGDTLGVGDAPTDRVADDVAVRDELGDEVCDGVRLLK